MGTIIGINIQIPTANKKMAMKNNNYPTILSCFATGIWEDEGIWLYKDRWSNISLNLPFLQTGFWNNEGKWDFNSIFKF